MFWLETKTFNMTFCASSYNKNYSSFVKMEVIDRLENPCMSTNPGFYLTKLCKS